MTICLYNGRQRERERRREREKRRERDEKREREMKRERERRRELTFYKRVIATTYILPYVVDAEPVPVHMEH